MTESHYNCTCMESSAIIGLWHKLLVTHLNVSERKTFHVRNTFSSFGILQDRAATVPSFLYPQPRKNLMMDSSWMQYGAHVSRHFF